MKADIYQYRASLVAKLAAVDDVIANMGGSVAKTRKVKTAKAGKGGKGKKRKPMSAAAKKKISEAATARWAKKKAGK